MSLTKPSIINLLRKIQPQGQWLVMIAGILIPAIIIAIFPKLFHASDVDDFWRWSQAWGMSWKNIYIDCDRCNYPFLGTLFSGGVMHWMGIDGFKEIVTPFRYYLVFVDGLNIVTMYFILTSLKIKNAPFWAGVIGLLPSSWIGSSVWGQIDGIGQFLILLMFALFIWFNLNGKTDRKTYYLVLAAAGLLLCAMLLTKQLIIFSLFSLGFMTLLNIFLYSRKPLDIALSLALVFISLITPILLIDSLLNLKTSYFSHLQYVLATGSQHGDTISSFGFNIWIFLVEKPLSSSHTPIYINWGASSLFSIIPYSAGILLFLLANAVLLFVFIRYFQGRYKTGAKFFDRENMLVFLLHLALVNLSFNLFLTGTHERYLYHFYPFIIVASLGLFDRNLVYLLLAGATFYGAVLVGYLTRFNIQFGQIPYWILGLFHFALYFYVIILFLRFNKSRKFEQEAQR